jgi:hypothetical protein
MNANRDRKPRPFTHAVLSGVVSGITRTIFCWIVELVTG